jgi:hypothetical protein
VPDDILQPIDLEDATLAAASTSKRRNSYFDEDGYLILWCRLSPEKAPILHLQSKSTVGKHQLVYLKPVDGYGVALLKMSRKDWDDLKLDILPLNELANHLSELESLPIYKLDDSFREWSKSGPDKTFIPTIPKAASRNADLLHPDFPFTLDDYIEGRCQELHPRFIYGDRSHFAQRVQEWFLQRDDSLIDDLSQLKLFDNYKLLFQAYTHLRDAFLIDANPTSENKKIAKEKLELAIEQFNCLANVSTSHQGVIKKSTYRTGESNTTLQQIFLDPSLRQTSSVGYWIAVQIHNTIFVRKEKEFGADSPWWATTAALFFLENPLTNGREGRVLWFSIDLHRIEAGETGTIVPDLLCFGLTDISLLLEPIAKCWEASGLASEFRGVWRLTSRYLGEMVPFKSYDHHAHISKLEGSSLQAAVLAAMWAASGRIPLAKRSTDSNEPFFHSVDGKSLRLLPNIAISGAIASDCRAQDTSIQLQPITDRSIVPKIQALVSYSPSRKPEESYFDTVIVVGKDAEEVRRSLAPTCEGNPNYRGIHIHESCKTIGDALELLLEVNVLKKIRSELLKRKWENQWGYDRDDEGRFRRRDGKGWITVSDSDTRPIQLKNFRDITIAGIDPASLEEAQRAELVARVKALGISTGEIEYMKRDR